MGGARVVRVNDLKLGVFEGSMSVLGIDISFKGLLRRLGLTFIDFFKMMPSNLIDWRQAHPIKGALRLDTVSQNLTKLHPADLANIIEDLNIKQGGQLVTSLDEREAAKVLEEMDPHLKKILIKHMGPEKVGKIIERMSVDEAVDVIKTLSKDEARHFLSFLQEGKSKTVQKLLSHPNDTAGGLMTTDFVRVTPDWTVGDTIDEIRKISPSLRSLLYVYVTNKRDIFQGTVSLRRLLLAQSHQKISSIMKKTRATGNLRVHNKINEITTTMTKYNLYSAAVLDKKKRLVGIVTIDDIMRRIRPNA
jgi:Mg/Co/Ni transporter MgtE